MKAAFFSRHGGPDVVEYGDLPDPDVAPGQVLVRVRAAAMNRVDKWVRDGWPGLKLKLPHVSGSDGAGEVVQTGAGAGRFQPGDRVVINASIGCGECPACRAGQDNLCVRWHLLGETMDGTEAQYVAVPERQLLLLPDGVTFESAAAAGLVFHTAWHSLITRGGLRPGETVLIIGAAGGVNTASIQIARLAGATVFVVGSGEKKLALARDLGADVLIDRSKDDWSRQVYALTGRAGVDVVVDNVGAATLPSSLRAARKGGRILTVGNTAGAKVEIDNRYMFGKHLSLIGSSMGTLADFSTVMGLVFAGRLRPVVDVVLPLSDICAAHERLDRGEVYGKIVLAVD